MQIKRPNRKQKNEIDKAFIEGLRLAQQELTGEVTKTQEETIDTPLLTETNQVSLFDSMSDVLKVTLRDNNRYDPNDINAAMLEDMGYTMAEAGKIIKKYNC